jgi:hypothetical protein
MLQHLHYNTTSSRYKYAGTAERTERKDLKSCTIMAGNGCDLKRLQLVSWRLRDLTRYRSGVHN